eukprot:TRINITY_DN16872_c0_g1_i1.p1 TRINITY_DN16872_c0_g1~~TRINITY_DN16872_c0_g1_i1.p1  ORF type:complete len:241 (+),score=38.87 TRINITY_DN16872_c0_g1_i1:51-725(+)
MASLPILYSFRRCPYCIRARLALQASGQRVELREVNTLKKPAALTEASPKGTVPTLVLPDGRVLDESLDVMSWALGQADPHGWLRDPLEDERSWQELLSTNDGPFRHHLESWKFPGRAPPFRGKEERTQHRDQALALLDRLMPSLSEGYLRGSRPTLVDMAILPFVRQFQMVDPAWFDALPARRPLQSWMHGFMASDLFKTVMAQQEPPWHPEQPAVLLAMDGE